MQPKDSAIHLNAEQEAKISEMHPDEIMIYMRELALEQGLVTPDPFDANVLHPTALADHAPSRVAKTIVFNGVKHLLEADDEAGLLAKENRIYRDALTQQPATLAAPEEPPRNESGQFVTAEEATALAARSADRQFEKSWADATEDFLRSAAGADWPGGDENRKRLGELLMASNLVDAPSSETLARAYEHMKRNGMLAENPEVARIQERDRAIAAANSDEEIRRACGLDPERGLRYQYQGENWRP